MMKTSQQFITEVYDKDIREDHESVNLKKGDGLNLNGRKLNLKREGLKQ